MIWPESGTFFAVAASFNALLLTRSILSIWILQCMEIESHDVITMQTTPIEVFRAWQYHHDNGTDINQYLLSP